MGVLQFPEEQYARVINTGEEVYLGKYVHSASNEVVSIHATILKYGSQAGNEQLKLNIYTTSLLETVLHSSSWSSISDIDNLTASSWYGRLRFDFPQDSYLENNKEYYITISSNSYTRINDTFYLAVILDWPITSNTQTTQFWAGGKLEFYGRE